MLPYPKGSGRRSARPSGPIPLNDNSPSIIKRFPKLPRERGYFRPDYFVPKAVSGGRPAPSGVPFAWAPKSPPARYIPSKWLPPVTPLALFFAFNPYGIPIPYDLYKWLGEPGKRNYPNGGYWKRTAGNFYYTGQYSGNVTRQSRNVWHTSITGQSIPGISIHDPVPDSWLNCGLWIYNWNDLVGRYAHRASFTRIQTPYGADNWGHAPAFVPSGPPIWADPFPFPGAPPPALTPPPYKGIPDINRPNPGMSPYERSDRGYSPPMRTPPFTPYDIVQVVSTAGISPPVRLPPRKPSPPPPGTKEKKFFVSINMIPGFAALFGAFTESMDVVKAVFDALPPDKRPGMYQIHNKKGEKIWVKRWHPSPRQMLEAIYKHHEHIDGTKMLRNLANNQIEDAVLGYQAQRVRDILRKLKAPAGPGTLGFDVPYWSPGNIF